MTKMQILAKTTLTVLGIHAVLTLCNHYPITYMYRREQPTIILQILSLCTFAVLGALTVYFMIFNNTTLAKRMAGPGEILDPRSRAIWLAKSFNVRYFTSAKSMIPSKRYGERHSKCSTVILSEHTSLVSLLRTKLCHWTLLEQYKSS